MNYYVLVVEGDVFPVLKGPFRSNKTRNDDARKVKRERGDEDGIYWLNVSKAGVPETGAYIAGFFEEQQPSTEVPKGSEEKK